MLRQLAVFCLRAREGGPPTLKAYWHIYCRKLHHWPSLSEATTDDMIILVTDDASYGILERGKELSETKTSSLISTVRKQKCLTLVKAHACCMPSSPSLHRIINYFCKILSQYTIYIHQTPVLSMGHTVIFRHTVREQQVLILHT